MSSAYLHTVEEERVTMMQVETTSTSASSSPDYEKSTAAATSPHAASSFDQDILALSAWLGAQTRKVYVGDVQDIENTFFTIRVRYNVITYKLNAPILLKAATVHHY